MPVVILLLLVRFAFPAMSANWLLAAAAGCCQHQSQDVDSNAPQQSRIHEGWPRAFHKH
jgi:hypothetical protein